MTNLSRIETLTLSPTLKLDPSAACTRRIGILGGTGSGKTYFASLLAEQLYRAGAPFLVIDPVGNWGYSLRLAADGKSTGLPIPVIGGDHADIDFDPAQGTIIGEFVRSRDASAVIDVSELSGAKMHTFVADVFEALYRVSRKRRTPYTVILEEAQTFIPQNIGRGEERMFGMVRRWGRLSRNYGGGLIIVTQRPQSVSKEVFNQIELMLVGNLRGPHERKAVREWVKEQGAEEVEAMLKELPKLPVGEFFCWSPEWLQKFERIAVGKKQTYDGSSTPVLGKAAEGRTLAPIDLGELGALMAAQALQQRATGKVSKALPAGEKSKLGQSQEAELRRKLADELVAIERERVGQRAAVTAAVREIGHAAKLLEQAGETLVRLLEHPLFMFEASGAGPEAIRPETTAAIERHADALGDLVEAVDGALTDIIEGRPVSDTHLAVRPTIAKATRRGPVAVPMGAPGERTIATVEYMDALLSAIAVHGPLDRHKLSILSGKSRSSSTFASAIRMLNESALIVDDRSSGLISATALGKKQAKAPALPTGRALYEYWKGRLGDYERKVFETIATGPKEGLSRADISRRTGQSYSSSTFASAFRTLRALGLIAERGGRWRLDETVRAACGL